MTTTSFSGTNTGLIINLATSRSVDAKKILAFGDSLTHGMVDRADDDNGSGPGTVIHGREGYRKDLWEKIVEDGNWVDFVGDFQNGTNFIDNDHSGVVGRRISEMVDGNPSPFQDDLRDHDPDVVLFKASTNDFNNNNNNNFFNRAFPGIMEDLQKAIDQFYAEPGSSSKTLVISTIPPKLSNNNDSDILWEYVNEGFTTRSNGDIEVGDTGNGTYTKGLRAIVEDNQDDHATLLLFDNPIDTAGELAPDEIHYTEAGFNQYAIALFNFLEAEGALNNGSGQSFSGATTEIIGSDAGDRIFGADGGITIDGGAGNDYIVGGEGMNTLKGGSGSNIFAFEMDSLSSNEPDVITDYGSSDQISIGAIVDAKGWGSSAVNSNVDIVNRGGDAHIEIEHNGQTITVAIVENTLPSAIDLITSVTTENGAPNPPSTSDADQGSVTPPPPPPPPSDDTADEGGDLAVSAPDTNIDADEDENVTFSVSGLDADATAEIAVTDGSITVVKGVNANGNTTMDLSGLADGNLTVSITASDGTNTANGAGTSVNKDTAVAPPPPPDPEPEPTNTVTGTEGRDNLLDEDPTGQTILGLGERDTIKAGGGDDMIYGGKGNDKTTGGTGADTFAFLAEDIDGSRDTIEDFDADEGDRIDLADVAETYGFSNEEMLERITLRTTNSGDLLIKIALPQGERPVALLRDVTAQQFAAEVAFIFGGDDTPPPPPPPPPSDDSADEDDNLTLTAPDTDIDGSEAAAVAFTVSGIDADATAVVTIMLNGETLTQPLGADGTVTFDLTGMENGDITSFVTVTDDADNAKTIGGPTVTLNVVEDPVDPVDPVDPPEPVLQELIGTDGRDVLTDDDDAKIIYGLDERDTIEANGGNDIIVGGTGNDKLFGGAGGDTFRYRAEDLDGSRDLIQDFSLADGDVIDVSEVGEALGWTEQELGDALSLRTTNSGDLLIRIDLPTGSVPVALVRNTTVEEFMANEDALQLAPAPVAAPAPPAEEETDGGVLGDGDEFVFDDEDTQQDGPANLYALTGLNIDFGFGNTNTMTADAFKSQAQSVFDDISDDLSDMTKNSDDDFIF